MSKNVRDILIEARENIEKQINRYHLMGDIKKELGLLYTYRTITKIIDGKLLDIFDFYIIENLKGAINE